jgi:alpha-L-rhamnosidase
MKKKIIITCLLFLSIGPFSKAQVLLPPVFQNESNRARQDEMCRVYLLPTRIMWRQHVESEQFLLKMTNGQTELGHANMAHMLSKGQDTASILLDYGRELHGGLRLVMGSGNRSQPSLVRIRFGESVQECNSTTNNSRCDRWPKTSFSTDDHAKRDFIIEIPHDGQIEIGNTGFRFVRIDLLQRDATIDLKEAVAIFHFRNIPYVGSFSSSDSRLDSIWLTGAYTTHLNMQEFLWDGIKRDRLVWIGDMHPETSTINCVFGDNQVVPNSLDFACKEFPLPKWLNNMPAYSMWYLIIQYEWWMHSADRNFINSHRSYILELIEQFDKTVDSKGDFQGNCFLDWPSSPNKEDVKIGVEALLVWSMKDAMKLCELFEDSAHADICKGIIERVSKHIDKPKSLKQAAALMTLSGTMTSKEAYRKYLSKGGIQGFSTFYGYYMLEAEAQAGEYQAAIDAIRQYWGAMLDMGATTFWEDFNPQWMKNANRIDEIGDPKKANIHGDFGTYCYRGFRMSLCHGWASGPTAWLTHNVLGVKIMEPGCKALLIEPHLGDLKSALGTYPTPYGTVFISHEMKPEGTIHSFIRKPKQVKIVTSIKDCTIQDSEDLPTTSSLK